ncbi:MAG: diaminopimelate decarboxylase [Burkholderiaceae bacterium]
MTLPPQFAYRDGELFTEGVSMASIADRFGTPAYVYSKAALLDAYAQYADALGSRPDGAAMVCYAVKANSNLAILGLFAAAGAGFDIVSGGELARVIAAGGDPKRVIFSGVGKTRDEMRQALDAGIGCFNVESLSEAHQLAAVARASGSRAPVSLRINPDVDARTHPYIATGLKESKFGIAYAEAIAVYAEVAALSELAIVGVDCHIGSQLLDDGPLLDALDKLIELVDALEAEGIAIDHLDLGGGVGIRYGDEDSDDAIDIADYLRRVFARVDRWRAEKHGGAPIRLLFEPGRSLVGNAGALLTRVLVLKPGASKNFAIVDAAMNDLLRPALYDAWHAFVPVRETSTAPASIWDIVGPVCESGDWLAHERTLQLHEGDLLACLSAGAYGMAMASNYNSRPRAAEVIVDGAEVHPIRDRETVPQLYEGERLLP